MHDVTAVVAAATLARRHGRFDLEAERRLEVAFGCSRWLAVYGTLAPNEQNHDQLATCPGTWSRGTVCGRRGEREFPVFTFDPASPPVAVQVLHSDSLPDHWGRLDAFEGDAYGRILVPVALAGRFVVANLYEARRPVVPPLP